MTIYVFYVFISIMSEKIITIVTIIKTGENVLYLFLSALVDQLIHFLFKYVCHLRAF